MEDAVDAADVIGHRTTWLAGIDASVATSPADLPQALAAAAYAQIYPPSAALCDVETQMTARRTYAQTMRDVETLLREDSTLATSMTDATWSAIGLKTDGATTSLTRDGWLARGADRGARPQRRGDTRWPALWRFAAESFA